MRKRMLVMGLAVGVAVGTLTSCGSSSTTPPAPGQGNLVTIIGDSPLCDLVSFRLTISGLTITAQTGGGTPTIIPTSSSFKVNVGSLRDLFTVLDMSSIDEGTYNQGTLSLSLIQMAVYDPTRNPPVRSINATLNASAPTFTISPPLTLSKGKMSVLQIDIDTQRSIALDASGGLSANVTPVLRGTSISSQGSQGFGELNDLVGFVRSVSSTNTTSNPSFLGNFLMQIDSSSLPQPAGINVNLTASTQLFGSPGLSQLRTGSFVEVDGYFDQDGNFVANTVEVEAQEDIANNRVALIGPIVSVTKDANGNVTQFQLWVRDEVPDDAASIPSDSTVVVNVFPSTTYQFSSRSANFANLVFGPRVLAVGQEVVVHGPFTTTTDQPTTVAAEQVYLKLQSIQGGFSSLVQVGSDDKTGAFRFAPCMSISQGQPVLILTNYQTSFLNLTGLSGLGTQPSFLIKGLLFFSSQGGTVNGVSVPPGSLVMLAKQVHQL